VGSLIDSISKLYFHEVFAHGLRAHRRRASSIKRCRTNSLCETLGIQERRLHRNWKWTNSFDRMPAWTSQIESHYERFDADPKWKASLLILGRNVLALEKWVHSEPYSTLYRKKNWFHAHCCTIRCLFNVFKMALRLTLDRNKKR